MKTRQLGTSGLNVSEICLGTMMFGNRTDEVEAGRIIASAREAGVNFVDTANQYAGGESESMLGKLIKSDRNRWIVASKCGNTGRPAPDHENLSRREIVGALEASLQRLGMEHVDIYYFHIDDERTRMEESIAAIGDMIRAGKTRYFGLSNFRGWRIAKAAMTCDALGVPRPIVCQPYYNAMNRMPEVEVIPASAAFGLGVVPYSPLARGILTGKYKPGAAPPEGTRAGRGDKRMLQTEFREESMVMAQTIKAHAEKRGMTAGQFALNWVLNNRAVSSALAGPRTIDHWTEYLGALKHTFSAEDEALIDKLVPIGHPSTPGYSDPKYPINGRRTLT